MMKTAIVIILSVALTNLYSVGQNSVKISSANMYSLEQDRKFEKDLIKERKNKLVGKVDIEKQALNLHSNVEQERIQAIELLGYFPYNEYITSIEKLLLNDQSAEVRVQCAKSLRILDSKGSIPSLIVALNDQDRNVRIFSLLTLAALGEKEKSSVAVTSLWNKGDPSAPLYSCHLVFRDLATSDAIQKLIYDLKNTDKFIAIDAAIILAQLGCSKEAYPFLKKSLIDDDKYIRMAALLGLGYIGDRNSLLLIKSKINDPNSLVRERVISILNNHRFSR